MPASAERFFVSGRAGGWRDVLTAEQAGQIERDHRAVMMRFGYL
jgi:aryl sulfotransferase